MDFMHSTNQCKCVALTHSSRGIYGLHVLSRTTLPSIGAKSLITARAMVGAPLLVGPRDRARARPASRFSYSLPVTFFLISQDDCDDCCPDGNSSGRSRACWGLGGFTVFIVLFAMSWDTLEPTEYGLVQNGFTGFVDLRPEAVYTGGRYFVWLRHFFLPFPANLQNLEFDTQGRRPPIPARTGPDPDDKESGGQPVTLSVSFQYQLQKATVPQVYQTYGLEWELSYMRFAQQSITNVAQQFTPKQFWNDRRLIQKAMAQAVNKTIFEQGFAVVRNLQLLKVDFKQNYEETITNIQLQEQLKVTKNYALDVTRVLKEVDILQSETEAQIALISSTAKREASVIINQAEADALRLEQGTKATWYSKLKQQLRWSNADFLQYVKIKSLSSQPGDSMVVGVSAMGEASA